MAHFLIDGFDFGVDPDRSRLLIEDSTFDLRLVGRESVIREIEDIDEHPWSWLLQPPFLYAIGVPCRLDTNGDFEHSITEQELDDYDIALYTGEHRDVLPCKISKKGATVAISGLVHQIRAAPLEFQAVFQMPGLTSRST